MLIAMRQPAADPTRQAVPPTAPHASAAEWAAAQVARVRDDPSGRMALLAHTYSEPVCGTRRYEPFRRAAMSFMRWQAERGVLRPPGGQPPGSPWWRAINERLLADGLQAMARAGGSAAGSSSATIELWMAFAAQPAPRSWYRAHNASVVTGYLEHRELAETESTPERFFLNVALLRVLYAHALVAAPRLSLGSLAVLGPLLGDPRRGMAGAFLSLRRVLPDRYPIDGEVATYLGLENRLARMLDYGVIVPRIQQLYEWSAGELGIPALARLARDGNPVYAYEDGPGWGLPRLPLPVRLVRRVTAARPEGADA